MDQLELKYVSVLDENHKSIAVGDYVEFYINGNALSEIINQNCQPKNPLLQNFTSTLGTMELSNFDRLKVKQLLGENIDQTTIEKLFPSKQFDQKPIFDELALPEVLIYCCAECADYKCGGVFAKINKQANQITWEISFNQKKLDFSFDKSEYENEFKEYLTELD